MARNETIVETQVRNPYTRPDGSDRLRKYVREYVRAGPRDTLAFDCTTGTRAAHVRVRRRPWSCDFVCMCVCMRVCIRVYMRVCVALTQLSRSVRAAIVTCGGLCPGLNTVIREIVMSLHYTYHCPCVLGVERGYGCVPFVASAAVALPLMLAARCACTVALRRRCGPCPRTTWWTFTPWAAPCWARRAAALTWM